MSETNTANKQTLSPTSQFFKDFYYFTLSFLPMRRGGPYLEVLQYQDNPWQSRSKLLRFA